MSRRIFTFRTIATALLTIGILILGGLNIQQKRLYRPPDDGTAWIEGSAGIQAQLVVPGGPSDLAGVRRGDILKAINGRPILNDRHVTQVLYELGKWSRAVYTIERDGNVFELGQPVVI